MKIKILVVEDNCDFRNMIFELLSKQGFLVHTACNGSEAMRILSGDKFDLVISDIEMSEGNGFWLAEQMKAAESATPILLMTGGDFSREQAQLVGALDLLNKPFQISTLLELINDMSKNLNGFKPQRKSS